jgi:hypothetical protein
VPLRDFPTPVGSDEPFQGKSLFIGQNSYLELSVLLLFPHSNDYTHAP